MPKRSLVLAVTLLSATMLAYGLFALPGHRSPVADHAAQAATLVEPEVLPSDDANATASPVGVPLPPAAPIEASPVEVVPEPLPEPTAIPATAPLPAAPAPAARTTVAPPPPAAPVASAPVAPPPVAPAPPTVIPTLSPPPPAAPAPASLTAWETQIFNDHNSIRAQNGAGSLQVDGALVAIARQRAADMATKGYFSHTQPDGRMVFDLLSAAGYRYAIAAENIARNNYPDVQSMDTAMKAFMDSPGHRTNILDKRFRLVGVGVAVGADGMKYVAVVFAG